MAPFGLTVNLTFKKVAHTYGASAVNITSMLR